MRRRDRGRGRRAAASATRRSRRNHDSCRRAYRRVAATVSARASLVGQLPVEHAQHLRVPERARRGAPQAQAAVLQRAHLVDQPAPPHPLDPRRDPGVEDVAGHVEADLDGGQRVGARRAASPGTGRPVSSTDLEGAHDPPAVGGQDRGGGRRVDARRAGRAARPAPTAASSASSRARTAGSVGGISRPSSTART